MKTRGSLLTIITALVSTSLAFAGSAGTSAGLTLLEASGARASSLGDAFAAMTDDISALGYNPASLGTLKSGQASFVFQKGIFEDSYGQVLVGSPLSRGGLGLSVGYYNGGDLQILDGTTEKTVNAQKDLSVGLGGSIKLGAMAIGITGKYLSSELAETAKATAYAVDFGVSMPIASRVRWAAAIQNIGTQLKFIEVGDDLPRVARTGVAVQFPSRKVSASVLVDGAYHMNEQEFRPSVGLETWVGPLAIRAGYKGGSDLQKFSVGSGFILGPSSLDYSFGLVDKLDARHQVSLSFRFGGTSMPSLVKAPDALPQPTRQAVIIQEDENPTWTPAPAPAPAKHTLGSITKGKSGLRGEKRGVYVIKEGDSLAGIAKKVYGKTAMWKQIFSANRHLLDDPESLEVGQKIVLP